MIRAIPLNTSKTYVLGSFKAAFSACSLISYVSKTSEEIDYAATRVGKEVTIKATPKNDAK